MRRGFFTFISGLSLLLCLGTAGLWLCIRWTPQRSFRREFIGEMRADGTRSHYQVAIDPEVFSAGDVRAIFPSNPKLGQMQPAIDWKEMQFVFTTGDSVMLVHWDKARPPSLYYWHITAVVLPYWAVVLATAIAPFLWFRSHRWRKVIAARNARRCVQCGYDLRATPQRCPECGRAMNVPAVAPQT